MGINPAHRSVGYEKSQQWWHDRIVSECKKIRRAWDKATRESRRRGYQPAWSPGFPRCKVCGYLIDLDVISSPPNLDGDLVHPVCLYHSFLFTCKLRSEKIPCDIVTLSAGLIERDDESCTLCDNDYWNNLDYFNNPQIP